MAVDVPGDHLFLKRLGGKAAPLLRLPGEELDVEVAGDADLPPPVRVQDIIELLGDIGLVSAGLPQVVRGDAQLPQALLDLAPLLRKGLRDDLQRVVVIAEFELLQKLGGDPIFKNHRRALLAFHLL